MDLEKLLYQPEGTKTLLLGNAALVRGAIEAGVQFISTYPGTPASEVGDIFNLLHKKHSKEYYFEYSTNEKVAMEAGIGASFSNMRTLVCMKHFGLNVASDALLPFVYTGSKGPTVVIVSDDPSCYSSGQTEENTRAFAKLANIPILEPSDPQECKDYIKLGFEISEQFEIPVIIRITTRVAHQTSNVKYDKIEKSKKKIGFKKDYNKFVTMPPRVLAMHDEVLEKIESIRKVSEKSKINRIEGKDGKFGIVTSGVSYLYVKEALEYFKLDIPIFKIGFFNPLATQKLRNFILRLNKVLVVEELDPYLEDSINILAKTVNPKLEVFGKDLLPSTRELNPELVIKALADVTGKSYKFVEKSDKTIVKRAPSLCAGCPYWSVFGAVKEATKGRDIIWGGGIGCYMLASFTPHNIQDYLLCMGSSVGIAHGIKKANKKQKVISFMGDSTFFHAGMPELANVVHNQSDPLIILMDNRITAMTGQQPYPGMESPGTKMIKIEKVVKALGVEHVKVIDPVKDYQELINTVKEYLKHKTVSVIIVRYPCQRI